MKRFHETSKLSIEFFRVYANEAMKQGQVFKDAAQEKLGEIASDTMKSIFNSQTFFSYGDAIEI